MFIQYKNFINISSLPDGCTQEKRGRSAKARKAVSGAQRPARRAREPNNVAAAGGYAAVDAGIRRSPGVRAAPRGPSGTAPGGDGGTGGGAGGSANGATPIARRGLVPDRPVARGPRFAGPAAQTRGSVGCRTSSLVCARQRRAPLRPGRQNCHPAPTFGIIGSAQRAVAADAPKVDPPLKLRPAKCGRQVHGPAESRRQNSLPVRLPNPEQMCME